MRKFSKEELKAMFYAIQNGETFCGIQNGFGVGKVFLTDAGNIGWEHFGSSANKNTITELKWIIETIFRDCEDFVEAKWSDYHINYIPKDPRYRGIDHSIQHPNILNA